MRILFVTNNYTPYSGGVVSSIDATVQELLKNGHSVNIVTLDFLGSHHKDPYYVKRLTCPVRFKYKNNYMAVPLKPAQELISLVKNYMPDVIHVHHPFLLGMTGQYVARIFDIPCIFTYHTLYEQYAHYIPLPLLCTQRIISYMVKKFCLNVDGIIVPSTETKTYLRKQKIISPIEVIPSPLRPLFLQADFYHQKSIKKQFFELLVVSRFTKEKNIPFVFDVFKKLPKNVRLTLAGYGAEYDYLQKLAFNVLKLSTERVHFIHKPNQADLLTLYQSADLFLFPSQTDTQGIVLAEAMSQGVPVIALDGPGQRDIIQNGKNGFIITSADAGAKIIQDIMNSDILLEHLKQGALCTAQKYLPSVYINQLLHFYHTVQ